MIKSNFHKIRHRGFSLVEIIIGSAIIASAFVAIISANVVVSKNILQNPPKTQSTFIAKEGIDAVRFMRDKSWTSNIATLTIGSNYYLSWNGSMWVATTTPNQIDSTFTRTFSLSNVYRDNNFNVADTGTLDSNARLINVNVTWGSAEGTSTKVVQSYLFNIYSN